MIKHYLKVAFRNLWRYKVQNLIGIVGLAVGFIVFSLCGYIIQMMFATDSQYPNADRIYKVEIENYSSRIKGNINLFTDNFTGIENVTSFFPMTSGLMHLPYQGKDLVVDLNFNEADTSYIHFFSLELVAGNYQTITHTPNSIVLKESIARKWGDPALFVGTTASIEDEQYQITGIVKDLPFNTSVLNTQGLVFNKTNGNLTGNIISPFGSFILLHKNVSLQDVQKQIDKYPFDFEREQKDAGSVHLKLLKGAETNKSETKLLLSCMFGIGLLVLLIALFNYISFQMAQFYNRLNECAIRKVNGASRIQQLLLFAIEVMLVFALACLAGLLIIDMIYPLMVHSGNQIISNLSQQFGIHALRIQLLKYALVGMAIAFVLCVFPANIIDRLSTRTVLLGLSAKDSKHRARNILMFVQMIILLIFLSATVIIKIQTGLVRQTIFTTVPTAEQKRIFSCDVSGKFFFENRAALVSGIKVSPYVEDVLFTQYRLRWISWVRLNLVIQGHEKENFMEYRVGPNYADFLHLKLLQGSFFTEASGMNDVVVDEKFASLFPENNVVGQTYGDYTIIGVMETVHILAEQKTNQRSQEPLVFRLADENDENGCLSVKAIHGKEKEVKQHILQCVRKFYPETLEYKTPDLYTEINNLFIAENALSILATVFAVISVIMSLLSIYSAIAMNTEKRRKEVAIRKINGAEIKDIIRLFCKSYVLLWTVACAVVFPLVYIVAKQWIGSFEQQMSLNVGLFVVIYVVVLALIMLTIFFRILRVARVNPAEEISKN
ncbi:ABC transporter permease [Bacteroidia bacterium]|nr:ABC transporter permease [Bacteroidia bacterium]GHT49092.1 ABC transporter permease [Bacteroidia bacterium]